VGQIAIPAAGAVYADANVIIYLVEKVEPYLSASRPLWDAVDGGRTLVTSELTLLETITKPLRDGNRVLAQRFVDTLLTVGTVACEPIARTTLMRAARIRADHGLKTPDAFHAATALEASCTMFVTNDAGFRRVPGLNVAVLGEIAAAP
jgi:predicted nucleic acid-binding protein